VSRSWVCVSTILQCLLILFFVLFLGLRVNYLATWARCVERQSRDREERGGDREREKGRGGREERGGGEERGDRARETPSSLFPSPSLSPFHSLFPFPSPSPSPHNLSRTPPRLPQRKKARAARHALWLLLPAPSPPIEGSGHACAYTHLGASGHAYAHTHVHACINTCVLCLNTHTCVRARMSEHTYMCARTHV